MFNLCAKVLSTSHSLSQITTASSAFWRGPEVMDCTTRTRRRRSVTFCRPSAAVIEALRQRSPKRGLEKSTSVPRIPSKTRSETSECLSPYFSKHNPNVQKFVFLLYTCRSSCKNIFIYRFSIYSVKNPSFYEIKLFYFRF